MTRSGLNFAKFNTHDAGHERAFEAFCNHLFEHWLNRQDSPVIEFRVINGSGGDGGIEAYGKLQDGRKIGIQAKWYLTTLQAKQIRAIKQSILTALDVHGDLTDLIVAVPRDLNNKRRVRGAIAKSTEQDRFDAGISKVKAKHSNLRLIFWGKHQLEAECFRPENSGVLRYWFR